MGVVTPEKRYRANFPLQFCNGGGSKKNKNDDAPTRVLEKCDDMSFRLDTVPALDRQTGGRTGRMVKQYRALHA